MSRLNPFFPGDLHIAQGLPLRGGYLSSTSIARQSAPSSDKAVPAEYASQTSRLARFSTLDKIMNMFFPGSQTRDLSPLTQPFFTAVQAEINKLKSAIPNHNSHTQDHIKKQNSDVAKICQQLPSYLLNKKQLDKANAEFQRITKQTLAELTAAVSSDKKESRFLLILDLLNGINVNVFKQYGFLSDAELRYLADMIVAGKIDMPWQEKAVKHLHHNIHQALPETGRYLLEVLESVDSSRMPDGLPALKVRMQSKSVLWNQKLAQFPSMLQKQLETPLAGINTYIALNPDLTKLFNEAERGDDWQRKMSSLSEEMQTAVEKIDLWEIHAKGEQQLITSLLYIQKIYLTLLDNGDGPDQFISHCIEMMGDKRMTDECCQAAGKIISNFILHREFSSVLKKDQYRLDLSKVKRESIPIIEKFKSRERKKLADELANIEAFSDALRIFIRELPPDIKNISRFTSKWRNLSALFKGSQKTATEILTEHVGANDERLIQILDCFDQIRLKEKGNPPFFSEDFLLGLVAVMASEKRGEAFYQRAIQLIDDNVYDVSDDTANLLLQKLEDGDRIAPSFELDNLKMRLAKIPAAKIPKMFKWIWRGGEWSTNTIEQMIKFHEMNPEHRIIAYSFNPADVHAALDKYVSQPPERTGDRYPQLTKRMAQATELKRVLEIRDRSVLNDPKILKLFRGSEISRLDAIAERNGEKTATAPNYPAITDMERLAVLHQEGGIYLDHNCIPLKPISENARAEAGWAGEVYSDNYFQFAIQNNAIQAVPANSKEIEALLKFLNNTYDTPRNKKTEEEKSHYLDSEAVAGKFKDPIKKIQAEEHPLTWTIGRFSYPHSPSVSDHNDEESALGTSRKIVTMRSTGQAMLRKVIHERWQTQYLNQREKTKLYRQAGGLFITPCIQKPGAPGKWAQGVLGPSFTVDDDIRIVNAGRKIEDLRKVEEPPKKITITENATAPLKEGATL